MKCLLKTNQLNGNVCQSDASDKKKIEQSSKFEVAGN